MGDLYLTLLGPPEVRHADQVLLFSTRKELALLIYLAVEGGVHSRKNLSEQFWPEVHARHGRAALRITLLHLRHMLCEGADVSPVPHILIKGDTLGMDLTSALELDLHILHEAWTSARASTHTSLTMPEEAHRSLLAQLKRAISLPRGEFLEGFSLRDAPAFDDWVRFQREYWHLRTSEVFDRLSQLQFEAGELEAALETVSRWLVLAPLHEDAYRRLMRLHFAAGDRAAALHAYDTCRALLATGMQTEPTPETVALASRMRAVAPPRRKEAPTPSVALSPATFLDGPLLGRTTELSTLIKVYHTAQRGQTQVVLLEGEVGIGKTRLATEFLAWAEVEGADVLQGQAFETGGQLPYRPVIEALRPRIERENAPDDLLSDLWLAELARLLPELCDRYPDLPAPTGDKSVARNRLFEAVARLGQALAARAPLVLFIDDVQWADAASLDVLQYASRRWAAAHLPVFLLCTFRSEDLASSVALADWLSSLERNLPVRRQTLNSLTFEDTLRLVESLFGAASGTTENGGEGQAQKAGRIEAWSRWLFVQTRGYPFFLIEHLKLFAEQKGLLCDAAGTVMINPDLSMHQETAPSALPSRVQDLIHERLTRLSHHALMLCMAAAVLGDGFTFDQLCRVADIQENQALSALDELLTRGLLRETGGRCFFAHDSIRAGAYTEASEIRRRVFHRRALETLQVALASPAELAHHARASGLPDAAAHLSIAAGDAAMRVFAARDAIAQYEQARQLVRRSNEH